jgi:putative heme-binding domain-containing protein
LSAAAASSLVEKLLAAPAAPREAAWTTTLGEGAEARVTLKSPQPRAVWLAVTELEMAEKATMQLLASANSKMRIWLDGKLILERNEAKPYHPDADRCDVTLTRRPHRILVEISSDKSPGVFHLRFRKKSASVSHEQLTQLALSRSGNPVAGRKVFFNVAKSQCLKCHRLENQGERIGPDLSNVGQRFGRIYLIESILEPSRSIAPSYESLLVELKDGRVETGLRVQETATTLTLADREGKKRDIPVADIASRQVQAQSIMPEGLERQLTAEEFVDLIAFLASRK